jgi:hypothetical protein
VDDPPLAWMCTAAATTRSLGRNRRECHIVFFTVRIYDAETTRETREDPPQNESVAIENARQTAETLADEVASALGSDADDSYVETDARGSFTVWRVTDCDRRRETVAYVVDVVHASLE